MKTHSTPQVLIIGGGIAGLWLLNRLRAEGHEAFLLEEKALGHGQTLASQGIIHGGLKYALNGRLSPASAAIADMPDRWRSALAGNDPVDLRGCRLLSEHYYMWSDGSLRSRLKSFLGSKALRGRIDPVSQDAWPAFFQHCGRSGTLYELSDFVLDTTDLLQHLANRQSAHIFKSHNTTLRQDADNSISVTTEGPRGLITLEPETLILCAGEGNAALLHMMDHKQPAMQKRPLHMVVMRSPDLPPVFTHCIGDDFGMTPRITISSHPAPDGGYYWYLGGDLAETGVKRSSTEQQAFAQTSLKQIFPALDLSRVQWSTFFINRAEPATDKQQRPDSAFVQKEGRVLTAWPTKLTLCPDLGDRVVALLGDPPDSRKAARDTTALRGALDSPDVAAAPWQELLP